MRIEAQLTGCTEAIASIGGLAAFAETPKAGLVEAGDLFLKIERRYLHKTARWTPLTRRWAKRKMKARGTIRPMVGGALERSLTVKGATGSVRRLNKRSIVMGTNNPVANIHNSGSRSRKMPPRTLIELTRADRQALGAVFAEHLKAAHAGSTRRGL